jgi:hypothetical protein
MEAGKSDCAGTGKRPESTMLYISNGHMHRTGIYMTKNGTEGAVTVGNVYYFI